MRDSELHSEKELVYIHGETEESAAVRLGITQQALSLRLASALSRMKSFFNLDLVK